jgi:hypothetical protein
MEHLTDEQLFDYVDGSCSAAEGQLYKTHLAGCADCRALYDEYRAVDAQLIAFALEPAPVQFTDKLMDTWASAQENAFGLDTILPGVSLDGNGLINFLQQEWLLNGFLLVNAVLGLLLFDKLVLKPFFEKKRQALAG